MDQPNNENKRGGMCMCGGQGSGWDCDCGYGHMHVHRHFVLRLILALVVIGVVFYTGVKVGEIKQMFFGGGYGHYRGYEYNMPYGYPTPVYNSGMVGGYGTSGYTGTQTVIPPTGSSVPAK